MTDETHKGTVDMVDKEAVRPIYSELQGYLAQAPSGDVNGPYLCDGFWDRYNEAVDELASTTGRNYKRFRLTPQQGECYIEKDRYRQALGGLIARLHAEYLKDEPVPFPSYMPPTQINVNQQQQQSVEIQLQQEIQNIIDEKLPQATKEEKTFLQKIKGTMSTVKSASEFIALVLSTAKSMGIPIEQLARLFS